MNQRLRITARGAGLKRSGRAMEFTWTAILASLAMAIGTTPVAKVRSARVFAGSIDLDGVLQVKATQSSANSPSSRISALFEWSLGNRPPLEHAVDRVARIFVPSMAGLSRSRL